jgi:DNA-binding FrmR family transcriptional regulator
MKNNCGNCTRRKHRTDDEKKSLIRRLNIIEGQINGIKQMIADDRYCDDVLIQISAVNKSLKSLGNEMLKSHLSTCVVEDINNGKLEVIDDVIDLFGKLNK